MNSPSRYAASADANGEDTSGRKATVTIGTGVDAYAVAARLIPAVPRWVRSSPPDRETGNGEVPTTPATTRRRNATSETTTDRASSTGYVQTNPVAHTTPAPTTAATTRGMVSYQNSSHGSPTPIPNQDGESPSSDVATAIADASTR